MNLLDPVSLGDQRVAIHLNLREHQRTGAKVYSVKPATDGAFWKPETLGYIEEGLLVDCDFAVKRGESIRTQNTGHKTVHACIRGTLYTARQAALITPILKMVSPMGAWCRVSYNPHKGDRAFKVSRPLPHNPTINRAPYVRIGKGWELHAFVMMFGSLTGTLLHDSLALEL